MKNLSIITSICLTLILAIGCECKRTAGSISATVTTKSQLPEYDNGSIIIKGTGFSPSHTIEIKFSNIPGGSVSGSETVVTDAQGKFTTYFTIRCWTKYDINEDYLNVIIAARDQQSSECSTFTSIGAYYWNCKRA